MELFSEALEMKASLSARFEFLLALVKHIGMIFEARLHALCTSGTTVPAAGTHMSKDALAALVDGALALGL